LCIKTAKLDWLLSTHLAELYEVPSRALVQAVKRNAERFPDDFMFQLSRREFANLKSQFVISRSHLIRRRLNFAERNLDEVEKTLGSAFQHTGLQFTVRQLTVHQNGMRDDGV